MSSPFELFNTWLSEAEKGGQVEPIAMVLSTVDEAARPTSRVVLLRQIENQVFYFFTNYNSSKSQMLLSRKQACFNFHWRLPFHRQVRIEGEMIKASREISDDYFKTRPRGSQIGAWSSPQSQEISSRDELEKRIAQFEEKFKGQDVPRPEFWGGFGLVANKFEFWQEGESRLHTRHVYTKNAEEKWVKTLVAP